MESNIRVQLFRSKFNLYPVQHANFSHYPTKCLKIYCRFGETTYLNAI